jgi:hypothetical protein
MPWRTAPLHGEAGAHAAWWAMPEGKFYEVREATKTRGTECFLARTKCSTTSSGAIRTPADYHPEVRKGSLRSGQHLEGGLIPPQPLMIISAKLAAVSGPGHHCQVPLHPAPRRSRNEVACW